MCQNIQQTKECARQIIIIISYKYYFYINSNWLVPEWVDRLVAIVACHAPTGPQRQETRTISNHPTTMKRSITGQMQLSLTHHVLMQYNTTKDHNCLLTVPTTVQRHGLYACIAFSAHTGSYSLCPSILSSSLYGRKILQVRVLQLRSRLISTFCMSASSYICTSFDFNQ